MRAGGRTLSLLSSPVNVEIIRALSDGSLSLTDLRRRTGSIPQTTMRAQMRILGACAVVERRQEARFPGAVVYELTPAGRELVTVAEHVQIWLSAAPDGALELGSVSARGALRALVDGWSSKVVRALAARPLALTQLDQLIAGINYPSLERRLGAMRLVGQVERCQASGRATPYRVTPWLREAMAPMMAAAQWERENPMPETANPISRIDIEAAFLLTVPMVRLPVELTGVCRLAVEVGGKADSGVAGVLVGVRNGMIASCVARLPGTAAAWASGSPLNWLRSVIRLDSGQLDLGGDTDLATALLEGLHEQVFSPVALGSKRPNAGPLPLPAHVRS